MIEIEWLGGRRTAGDVERFQWIEWIRKENREREGETDRLREGELGESGWGIEVKLKRMAYSYGELKTRSPACVCFQQETNKKTPQDDMKNKTKTTTDM